MARRCVVQGPVSADASLQKTAPLKIKIFILEGFLLFCTIIVKKKIFRVIPEFTQSFYRGYNLDSFKQILFLILCEYTYFTICYTL